MAKTSMSAVFRALLARGGVIVKPGAHNALSARIIEAAGFESIGVSGYAVSVTLLGKPDCGLVTLDEMVMMSRYIAGAVNIPAIADADTGYGNAINVMRTVEDFIRAGVAGIHMEDQVAPKRCGHVAGKQVIAMDEAAGKIRAAARVRDEMDPDFVLIARCDARGVAGGSLEDAITRCQAYRDAGADVCFPEGLLSADEIAQVCDAVGGAVLYNRTGVSPNLHTDVLQKLGVDIVINPGGAMRAAANAMWDYYAAFADEDNGLEERLKTANQSHPLADFHGFVGFPEIRELEELFLPEEEADKYDGAVGFQP